MKEIVIFGTSTLSKVAHFYFKRDEAFKTSAFAVDASYKTENEFCGLSVYDFETLEETHPPSNFDIFIAIGPSEMNSLRQRKMSEAKAMGYELVSFVSRKAVCDSPLGENCFVGDFAVVNPFVTIGNNSFIWEHAYVGNESKVGHNCFISPKASVSSFAEVGNNSFLGTNSVIKTRATVAEFSLIGANSFISRGTEPFGVYGEKQSQFAGAISYKVNLSG